MATKGAISHQQDASFAFVLVSVAIAMLVVAGTARSAGNAAARINAGSSLSPHPQMRVPSHDRPRVMAAYGRLPLSFEQNQRQAGPGSRFIARGDGYTVLLASTEAVLRLRGGVSQSKPVGARAGEGAKGAELRMRLVGANANAQASGLDRLPGDVNYLIGNDPSKWRTNIPIYGKVKYAGVYRGVDLTYYGNHRQLEYDFVVAPGADPRAIAIEVRVAPARLDEHGNLVIPGNGSEVLLRQACRLPAPSRLAQADRRPLHLDARASAGV